VIFSKAGVVMPTGACSVHGMAHHHIPCWCTRVQHWREVTDHLWVAAFYKPARSRYQTVTIDVACYMEQVNPCTQPMQQASSPTSANTQCACRGGTLNTWRSGDDGRTVAERLQVRF
jgi:hypothetical protein